MAVPIHDKKAETVAKAFLQHWVQGLGGMPESILVDQGKEFTSRTTRGMLPDLVCGDQVGTGRQSSNEPRGEVVSDPVGHVLVPENGWGTQLVVRSQDSTLLLQSVPPTLPQGWDLQLPSDLLRMELPPDTSQAGGPRTVAAQLQDLMSILIEAK